MKLQNGVPAGGIANQTHINLQNFNKNAATTMSSGFQKQLAAIQGKKGGMLNSR
jgi:hypothetical protein